MSDSSSKTGIGFLDALTLVFVVLKLCHVIAWKWVWVLSPVWISLSVALVCTAIIAIEKGRSRHDT